MQQADKGSEERPLNLDAAAAHQATASKSLVGSSTLANASSPDRAAA